MPDAQPKPTAAEVLAVHWDVCGDGSQCDCGWQRPLRPGAATPGRSMHLRHQADMLAAAGLLVTAEHDAQVLRAWGESLLAQYPEDVFVPPTADAYDRVHRARGALGITLDALSAEVMRRGGRLALEEADRIAAGGES